jgi:EAL domain-containing protein (putative c-di-GMP-specific phosphodiesterase class I)
MLKDLGIQVICEGIETPGEFDVLRDMGVELMQGYLFGKPSVASVTTPVWPTSKQPENRACA